MHIAGVIGEEEVCSASLHEETSPQEAPLEEPGDDIDVDGRLDVMDGMDEAKVDALRLIWDAVSEEA